MTAKSILRECVVYGLYSSGGGGIRYVGQTTMNLGRRVKSHISRSLRKKTNTHKDCWIRKTIELGFDIKCTVLKSCATWNKDEIYWIEKLTLDGARLVNSTKGGEGMLNAPQELRDRISESVKALWSNPAYRAKITLSGKGKKWSDAARAANDNTDPKIRSQRSINGRKNIPKDVLSLLASNAAKASWAFKRLNGTDKGVHCNSAKLNDYKVLEARRMYACGETQESIAGIFGVSRRCIGKIVHRHTWTHI